MCLHTKQIKPLVAEKDIVAYKFIFGVFYKKTNKAIKYFSPFITNNELKHGVNLPDRDKDFQEENKTPITLFDSYNNPLMDVYKVSKGWLHAFINDPKQSNTSFIFIELSLNLISLKYAIANSDNYDWKSGYVKMIIPKGAKYFIGIDGDICSDKLYWDENEEPVWDDTDTEPLFLETQEKCINDTLLDLKTTLKDNGFFK